MYAHLRYYKEVTVKKIRIEQSIMIIMIRVIVLNL